MVFFIAKSELALQERKMRAKQEATTVGLLAIPYKYCLIYQENRTHRFMYLCKVKEKGKLLLYINDSPNSI